MMQAIGAGNVRAANVAGHGAVPPVGLAALVDEFAHGMAVTAFDGRLLQANHAARNVFAQATIIRMTASGFVRATCRQAEGELHDALERAMHGKRTLVNMQAAENHALSMAVLPLKDSAGQSVCCALLFSRAKVCDTLMLGFFARRHSLTPAEEQVLAVLCEGFSAPQVAARLQVAVSTVRSHVRSICRKTRSRSVRQLLQRVALLPPLAPLVLCPPMH